MEKGAGFGIGGSTLSRAAISEMLSSLIRRMIGKIVKFSVHAFIPTATEADNI